MTNTYYKTSADYHDALDRMEARERAERAEAEIESKPICVCLEYIGDNGYCPVHGQPISELDGSDTSVKAQLNDSGFGCSSTWWNSIEEIPF